MTDEHLELHMLKSEVRDLRNIILNFSTRLTIIEDMLKTSIKIYDKEENNKFYWEKENDNEDN